MSSHMIARVIQTISAGDVLFRPSLLAWSVGCQDGKAKGKLRKRQVQCSPAAKAREGYINDTLALQ